MNNNEGTIPQRIARLEGIASTMRRSEGNRAPSDLSVSSPKSLQITTSPAASKSRSPLWRIAGWGDHREAGLPTNPESLAHKSHRCLRRTGTNQVPPRRPQV
jgi:hypothetical protein